MQYSLIFTEPSKPSLNEVTVHKMIGGHHGTKAEVLKTIQFEREKKYLLKFPDGVEFWTNELSIIN